MYDPDFGNNLYTQTKSYTYGQSLSIANDQYFSPLSAYDLYEILRRCANIRLSGIYNVADLINQAGLTM